MARVRLEPGPEPCIAVRPSENWRKNAADGAGAEAHKKSHDFVVRNGVSQGYLFIITDEVSANLYVTPGSDLYVHYSGARKKLLKESFVMEEVDTSSTSVSVSHGHV